MKQKRIQRKRTKDWRIPDNTKFVGRPTKWGNQCKITEEVSREESVRLFSDRLDNLDETKREDLLTPLRGRNLACLCKVDQPYHADIPLQQANPE